VSATGLFAHLEEFAKRVKLSGTPEELESFHYLQRQLDSMGFATTLKQHDAYISLPGAARLEAGLETPACITHSFSRPGRRACRASWSISASAGSRTSKAGTCAAR